MRRLNPIAWLQRWWNRRQLRKHAKKHGYSLWSEPSDSPPQIFVKDSKLSRIPSREISSAKQRIAAANLERQKASLGHGLKGVKPRPAFEKRVFDIRKKPREDDEEE